MLPLKFRHIPAAAALAALLASGCASPELEADLEPRLPLESRILYEPDRSAGCEPDPTGRSDSDLAGGSGTETGEDEIARSIDRLVLAEFILLEEFHDEVLDPLSAHAGLISVARGASRIRSSPRLTSGARISPHGDEARFAQRIEEGDLGRSAKVASLSGVLAPGVTTLVEAIEPDPFSPAGESGSLRKRIAFRIRPSVGVEGAGPSIRLIVEALVTSASSAPESGAGMTARSTAPVMAQREEVTLDTFPATERDEVLLVIPSPFLSSPADAVAVHLTLIAPADADGTESALLEEESARCLEAVREARSPDGAGAAAALERSEEPALTVIVNHLSRPGQARGALVFLAGATDAAIAEDIALAAPDRFVADLAGAILERANGAPPADPAKLGWLIERSACALLAADLETGTLHPGQIGILARHTGEVGCHADLLEEIAAAAASLPDFRRRLVTENTFFLEDNSPASRIRAFDWLAERNGAPEGYDPLAPLKQRRAALEEAAAGTDNRN